MSDFLIEKLGVRFTKVILRRFRLWVVVVVPLFSVAPLHFAPLGLYVTIASRRHSSVYSLRWTRAEILPQPSSS